MYRRLFISIVFFSNLFNSFGQDCEVDIQKLLPDADVAQYTMYGASLDLYNDYLVVGSSFDHFIESQSGAGYVYRKGIDNNWLRIATITPSDRMELSIFSTYVFVDDNIIIALGSVRDVNQEQHFKIYVYEKSPEEEWASTTESYQFGVSDNPNSVLDVDFDGTHLAVTVVDIDGFRVNIYKRGTGEFTLVKQYINPSPSTSLAESFGHNISIEGNTLIVSATNMETSNDNYGMVFLFENVAGSWSDEVSTIFSAETDITGEVYLFGQGIIVYDDVVYIISRYQQDDKFALYAIEKPVAGWANANVQLSPAASFEGSFRGGGIQLAIIDRHLFLGLPWEDKLLMYSFGESDRTVVSSHNVYDSPLSNDLLFGVCIAGNDEHLVVGASTYILSETGEGAVVVYNPDATNWLSFNGIHAQILSEKNINATGDAFGFSTSSYEHHAVVGAPGDQEIGFASGAAYLYSFDGSDWVKVEKILSPDFLSTSRFGSSVAMGDSVMFVGAPEADSLRLNGTPFAFSIGKVYVYRLTSVGWSYSHKIIAPIINQNARFGQAISWSPGVVAISEYKTSDSESKGKVHIYLEDDLHNWNYSATLLASDQDQERGSFFGRSLAMNDSVIVVATGNVEYNNVSQNRKVYVYTAKNGTWISGYEDARLLPSTKQLADLFGFSVGIYGDNIIVGSPGYPRFRGPVSEYSRGVAYIFEKPIAGWNGVIQESATLSPSDPSNEGLFGYSVAIDGNDAFVGSPHSVFPEFTYYNNDNNLIQNGKVYHFKRDGVWISSSQEIRQFFSDEPEWLDGFGYSLSIFGRVLFVGCVNDDTELGFKTGSVFTITQDPVIVEPKNLYCIEDGHIILKGYPLGGEWTGVGFNDTQVGIFDPSGLTPDAYNVSYSVPGCAAFSEVNVISRGFDFFGTSSPQSLKCVYDEIMLSVYSDAQNSHFNWFHRNDTKDPFQQILSGSSHLVTKNSGFFKSEIYHPVCQSIINYFEVHNDEVKIELESIESVCDSEPILLHGTPQGGIWSGKAVNSLEGIFDPSLLDDGQYSVSYTFNTEHGCTFSDNLLIEIDKLEIPTVKTESTFLCIGESTTIQIEGNQKEGTLYNWLNTDNQILSSNTFLEVTEPGTYWVELQYESCFGLTEAINIETKLSTISVPNVFTPNGDNFNDVFKIEGTGLYGFSIKIIDRTGNTYLESNNPNFEWNGQNAPTGTYFWHLTFVDCNGRTQPYNGWVQLIK